MSELFFLIVPSYPVASVDDMASYRAAAKNGANRQNVSWVDYSALTSYAEITANGWLKSDGIHANGTGFDNLAPREVALIPAFAA